MHAKFQVAEFKNKRYIRHRPLDFVCLFLLGLLLVQVNSWFLASDGSEIGPFHKRIVDRKHRRKGERST